MTSGGGHGAGNLGDVWINVVPSMAGSQAVFQQAAREAAEAYAGTYRQMMSGRLQGVAQENAQEYVTAYQSAVSRAVAGGQLTAAFAAQGTGYARAMTEAMQAELQGSASRMAFGGQLTGLFKQQAAEFAEQGKMQARGAMDAMHAEMQAGYSRLFTGGQLVGLFKQQTDEFVEQNRMQARAATDAAQAEMREGHKQSVLEAAEAGANAGRSFGTEYMGALGTLFPGVASRLRTFAPLFQSSGKTSGQAWYQATKEEISKLGDGEWLDTSKIQANASAKMADIGKTMGAVGKAAVVGAGVLAAFEFVHTVEKEFKTFERVGEDAANTLMSGFESLLHGKMPDLMATFNVFEEGAKAAFDAPLEMLKTFIPMGGELEKAFNGLTFGALDKFKDTLGPLVSDIMQVGNQYLGLQRTLAASTINTEGLNRLSGAVREIMASGAVVHFDDVADSIGRLNQNIKGLSTGQLKELTTTFAEGEELVGKIDETKFAGIINAWKIPGAEANETLTMLVNTARATGVNINLLTDEMTRSGPSFRDLGYNAQQTAAFFGEMTAQGEKGTRLIFAMAEADKKLNEVVAEGKFKNTKEAWDALLTSVKAYEDAGQHAAAMGLLEQYVTPSTAAMLVEMIKEGKVAAGQLGDSIQGVGTDLKESVEKTKDLGQTFDIVGQQISAAMAPIGGAMAMGLRTAGEHVSEWLKDNQSKVAQWGVDVVKVFATVMGTAAKLFMDTLAFLGPLFDAMKAAFSTAARIVLDIVRPTLDAIGDIPGMGGLHKVAGDLNNIRQLLDNTQNFSFDKTLTTGSNAVDGFVDKVLPQLVAKGQSQVDDLKIDEGREKRGFKLWFEDDDPTKVKVKGKTEDDKDIKDSSDLVPPGETTLTFTPGFDVPKWHGQAPPTGFAFGGPTVQGAWVPGKDSIPAMLEVGEYVVRRDQAQKHRRQLDAINYGYAEFDSGGEVDPGLRVIYSFLRGVAGGFGLNLPKEKRGTQGAGSWQDMLLPSGSSTGASGAQSPHSGDIKQQAYQAMLAAGGKPEDFKAVDYIFQHESSWTPTGPGSINTTDINAQHGDPSKGLGQLISGNYRAAGVDPNTTSPYEQTYAAVKYMQSRYGGIQQAYQYWLGHHNYAEGGHVGGGGSWYGGGDHKENKGLTTGNLFRHFAKGFSGGGPACSECGGAHPTAFHSGGIAHFGEGGGVGGVSQVIWSDLEDPTVRAAHGDAGIGVGYGKVWSGGPGSPYSDETNAGGQGYSGHHGHVHTTFTANPFTGEKYGIADQNTTLGDWSAFPPWVHQLGDMYGLDAKTYTGHQVFKSDGLNHGIDWYPRGKQDMSGKSYSHNDNVTLTGFAQSAMAVGTGHGRFGTQAGNSGFMEFGSQFPSGGAPGSGVQLAGFDVPQGGGSLPGGSPFSADGGDGSAFGGGSFPPGSPVGPSGITGPGYNPWTNPPPGLSPTKMQEYTHKYEEWQLAESKRQRAHGEAQDALTQAITDQKDSYQKWKALDDKWRGETADQQKLDTKTQKELKEATDKLDTDNATLQHAKDTATQDQLDDQVGHPAPQPGNEGGGRGGPMEGIAQQLGGGLVKGIAQAFGFPDVFGKPPWEWGISKLLMGGLGFGLNVANSWSDRAMKGDGGPLAGMAPGGAGFPGSLPGLSGGPQGMPPGPAGSPEFLPPSPAGGAAAGLGNGPVIPPGAAPGTPNNPVTVQGAPNKPPVSTEPAKPPPLPQGAVPKPPLPEPGQPGGGPPLGLPNFGSLGLPGQPFVGGTGIGAPFGIPGLDSNSLFNVGGSGDGGGGSDSAGPISGLFGSGIMKKLLDKAPNMLVGMQDEKYRDKILGGLGVKPQTMTAQQTAGAMQNQGGQGIRQPISQGGNVTFNVNASGINTHEQVGKVVHETAQTMGWPGAWSGPSVVGG